MEAYFSEGKKNWLRWSRDGEGLRAIEPQVPLEELCLEVGGRRCPVAQRLAVSGGSPVGGKRALLILRTFFRSGIVQ